MSKTYTMRNQGIVPLQWTAQNGEQKQWLSVSPASGSLAAGAQTVVTVSLTDYARRLTKGTYWEYLIVTDTTNGYSYQKPISLTLKSADPQPDPTPGPSPDPGPAPTPAPDSPAAAADGGGGGGGGGCFIATAVYGADAWQVKALKEFRDRWLLTNKPGQALTGLYYRSSPTLAGVISRNPALKRITDYILTPLVYALIYPILTVTCFVLALAGFFTIRKWRQTESR